MTGASSGIGKATAILLAQRGAKVIATARRRTELGEVVAAITAAGGDATSLVVDVTKEDDVPRDGEACGRYLGSLISLDQLPERIRAHGKSLPERRVRTLRVLR